MSPWSDPRDGPLPLAPPLLADPPHPWPPLSDSPILQHSLLEAGKLWPESQSQQGWAGPASLPALGPGLAL